MDGVDAALLERYRAMTEEASDIIIMHENERIVFASGAMWRLLKRTPEEFQYGKYLELVHPDDLVEARKVLGQPPPGVVWTATYRVRHADGHYLWFEIATRGQYDDSGKFIREVSVGRDITARKEDELKIRAAQERAEAANRAKSLFLANMSHELRTPLNAIIGFGDMMRSQMFGALGDARYADYANQIFDAGNRLLGIISDLLDMSRIEAGLLELSREPIEMAPLVEQCVEQMGAAAAQRGVALKTNVPEVMELVADRRAMKQILMNLLANAVKFTGKDGHVTVEARDAGGAVHLIVRDDGVGIPAADIPRLGRAFEQVCADPRLAKNGAGLGLALVRALAERHGGTMHIDSEVGIGTTVTITLPRDVKAAVAAA